VRPDVRRSRREGVHAAPLPAAAPSSVHCARSPAPAGATKSMWSPTDSLSFRSAGAASAVPGDVRRDRYRAPSSGPASAAPPAATSAASAARARSRMPAELSLNRMRVATRRAVAPRRCQGAGRVGRTGRSTYISWGGSRCARSLPVLMFLLATVRAGTLQHASRTSSAPAVPAVRVSQWLTRLPASNGRGPAATTTTPAPRRAVVRRDLRGGTAIAGCGPASRTTTVSTAIPAPTTSGDLGVCKHNSVGDGTRGDDGDPCTVGDRCTAGTCRPVDDLRRRLRCTGRLLRNGGACVHQPDSSVCVAPNECAEPCASPVSAPTPRGAWRLAVCSTRPSALRTAIRARTIAAAEERAFTPRWPTERMHTARPVLSPRGPGRAGIDAWSTIWAGRRGRRRERQPQPDSERVAGGTSMGRSWSSRPRRRSPPSGLSIRLSVSRPTRRRSSAGRVALTGCATLPASSRSSWRPSREAAATRTSTPPRPASCVATGASCSPTRKR
jgi:hypothetical protein